MLTLCAKDMEYTSLRKVMHTIIVKCYKYNKYPNAYIFFIFFIIIVCFLVYGLILESFQV